jgi:hypothetical protein
VVPPRVSQRGSTNENPPVLLPREGSPKVDPPGGSNKRSPPRIDQGGRKGGFHKGGPPWEVTWALCTKGGFHGFPKGVPQWGSRNGTPMRVTKGLSTNGFP